MNKFEEAKKLVGTTEVGSDGVEVECRSYWNGQEQVRWVTAENALPHRADNRPAVITEDGEEFFCENGFPILKDRPREKGGDGSLVYWESYGDEFVLGPDGKIASFSFAAWDMGFRVVLDDNQIRVEKT